MKSVFEDYIGNQHVWKTYGHLPLFENEKRLIEEFVFRSARASGHMRILDAGTGSGRIAFRIKEHVNVSIDAFDFVPSFIEQAIMTHERYGLDIHFFVKDAIDLRGIANETYDVLIYLQQLLCHIPKGDQPRALTECARVCKPGGILLLSYASFDNRTLDRLLDLPLAAIRFSRRNNLCLQERPYLHINNKKGKRVPNCSYFGARQSIIYWFKKAELENALASVGFDVIKRLDADKRIVFLACQKR